VDSGQVGVLEKGDEVSFRGFLEGTDGRRLESEVGLEILGDFTDQTLEGKLPDQELGGLLVPSDFTKGDGTRLIPVRPVERQTSTETRVSIDDRDDDDRGGGWGYDRWKADERLTS
jgi:hypothetical protein